MKNNVPKSTVFIQDVQKLRRREHRLRMGLTIVEGYPELRKAMDAGVRIETLYICKKLFTPKPNEFDNENIIYVTVDEFDQMAFGDRLKGILALCAPKQNTFVDLKFKKNPFFVVLEGVEKPGNLGAVVRTCDGAGVDGVIMCEGRTDVYNHNVVRSSLGTIFVVPTLAATKEETFAFFRKHNVRIYATTSKATTYYSNCDFNHPSAIVVGSEHEGLSSFWLENSDDVVKIPMAGQSSSLNVGISASILIYEAMRQRQFKKS